MVENNAFLLNVDYLMRMVNSVLVSFFPSVER